MNSTRVFSSPVIAASASVFDSGKAEMGFTFVGMKRIPTTVVSTRNETTMAIAAGLQIVVASGIGGVRSMRKWFAAVICSGADADRPNCQIDPTPASTAIIQLKSTGM